MNAIFRYLKSKIHVLLFIFLEIFCISAIVRYNIYQSAFYFNNTKAFSAKMHEANIAMFDYFSLFKKNEALFNENIQLRRQLKDNFLIQPKQEFTINDTVYKQRYEYVSAKVITNSINNANNFITLNRGSSSGISKGMGVFCPSGVIGTVMEVSNNYCIVLSVLNIKNQIVPKIKEMNNTKGFIEWLGKDPNFVTLNKINKYEDIKVGYHVVTSPYSNSLPENIPIGTVQTIEKSTKESFYKINVRLAVDFGSISDVCIVKNLFKKELEELQNTTQILNFNK